MKVEDITYTEGKHPDEVYVDLIVMFGEFIDKNYSTKKLTKKPRSKSTQKATLSEWYDWMDEKEAICHRLKILVVPQ